jgi:hypothetical protein
MDYNKDMVGENVLIWMDQYMMEIGNLMRNKEKEKYFILMGADL